MVSLNSEVHSRKESRLMQKANRTKTAAGTAGSQLDKELAFLFGRSVLAHSKRMSLEDVADEAELVAEAAAQLRQHGEPEQQRRIVRSMAEDAAAALCKWIREPGCMSAVIARGMN